MNTPDHRLNSDLPFLSGGGDMGKLARQLDWGKTAIGEPTIWPTQLKQLTGIVLNTPSPMLICWGKAYTQIYNDSFRPILGANKHPQAMGIGVNETYNEVWDTLEPLFTSVMQGQSVTFEDFKLNVNRNGYQEDLYFDFSYSPITDENADIKGILVICQDVTNKVTSRLNNEQNRLELTLTKNQLEDNAAELQATNEELKSSNEELAATNEELAATNEELADAEHNLQIALNDLRITEQQVRSLVESAPFPIGVYVGREMRITLANQSIIDVWDKGNDVIGKLYSEILPELANQPIFAQLDAVFTTGAPFHARNQQVDIVVDGKLQPYYFNYSFTPLYDIDGNIYGVMNTAAEVTDLNVALQKVEHNEQNLHNMILQAPIAMCILMGPDHVVEVANQLMVELWGKPASHVMDKPIFDALPDARGQGLEAIMANVYRSGETFRANELPVSLLRNGRQDVVYQNFVYEPYRDTDGTILGIIAITIDVTEQVLARQKTEDSGKRLRLLNDELAAANEQFRLAISTANLGTWSVDLKTDKLTISGRSRKMHGLAPGDKLTLTQSMEMVLPPHRDKLESLIKKAIDQNSSFEVEYQIQPRDGSAVKWLRSTGRLYLNNAGEKASITGTILDVTERKLDELRKNDFIGMVSHELKTPLTSLTAIVQVSQAKLKHSQDAFLNGAMDKANAQVRKMSKMINGFLDISRLESGKLHVEKKNFRLDQLIREIIDEVKLTAHELTIELEPLSEISIIADHDKIGSVLTNLLTNAVKYSSKKSTVTVNCTVSKNLVQISVKDEGMGIKPQDLSKLFNRYFRVESSNTKHIAGFGIGLYLSAEIIKQHQGKIWAQSEEGKGSTFYFELPLK